MTSSAELLGPDGPFSHHFRGFAIRDGQQKMATAIEETIETEGTLIAESGTGTGKTFAYLVPILSSGKRAVVSSYTIALQEQVFYNDIPRVSEALDKSVDAKLLKGRSNYVCKYRLHKSSKQPDLLDRQANRKIERIRDWVTETEVGDIAQMPGISNSDSVWKQVTTTTEACIGQACDWYRDCYALRARRDAAQAEIVVVNHKLLCLGLQSSSLESGVGVQNHTDVVIVDEAHRLPDIAAETMGIHLSHSEIMEIVEQIHTDAHDAELGNGEVEKYCHEASENADSAKVSIEKQSQGEHKEGELSSLKDNASFRDSMDSLMQNLRSLHQMMEPHKGTHPQIEKTLERIITIDGKYQVLFTDREQAHAEWFRVSKDGFSLSSIPLDPGETMGEVIEDSKPAWVFTSATLNVNKDFSHFKNRLGVQGCETRHWPSPFQYDRQSLTYLPPDMPDPGSFEYDERVSELVLQVAPKVKGGTFVLFTNYRSMNNVEGLLEESLAQPLLVQGAYSRFDLLEMFKEHGNSVLLGTTSFWEGVDVKGEALSCVIVTKLPFAPFDTPIMRARRQFMQDRGMNFFREWQVPVAALALKQGAGRLIRDTADRGVLVICDPRIRTKDYGQIFLDTLPAMQQTSDVRAVEQFFNQ